jgi:hypothetical protein
MTATGTMSGWSKPFNASDWYGRVTLDLLFSTSYTSDAPWNNTGFKQRPFRRIARRCAVRRPMRLTGPGNMPRCSRSCMMRAA